MQRILQPFARSPLDFINQLKKMVFSSPADILSEWFYKLSEKENSFAIMLQINLAGMYLQADC